nr:hypothetical protein [uncultured Rhodopila sp.]
MVVAMRSPGDAALLDIWEQGQARGPVARTKLLLGAALPELDDAERAALAVSAADIALLRLRGAIFGGRLPAETTCPACAEVLEFELDAAALIHGIAKREPDAPGGECDFREPAIGDLEAIAGIADPDAAMHRLASLCRRAPDASPNGAEIERIDALYGQTAIRLRLDCAACGNTWHEVFDVAAYLWQEVARRAGALLDEIHILAAAYGWSEAQILALSETRRTAYLQRCGA